MLEAWKIGVALSLTSNHAQVLGELAAGLGIIERRIANLVSQSNTLKVAVAGAMSVFVGKEALSGLTAIIEKTKDLSHELTQLQKMGNSAADTADLLRAASDVARTTQGINRKEVLDIAANIYSLTGGNVGDVKQALPLLSKYGVVMGNTTGDMGATVDSTYTLVRAAEQMGRFTNPVSKEVDLDRFSQFLDMATRIGAVTHGKVNADTWYQMAKTGGPGMMNMSDRGLEEMAIASQYMGGPRAGTALMSSFSQFAGGVMPKRTALALQALGVLHEGEWSGGSAGMASKLTPEARARLGGQMSDPLKFMTDTIIPALKAKGYDTTDKQIEELFTLFGRQTTVRLMADLLRNSGQIQREMGLMDRAPGLSEQYGLANAKDVDQNIQNVKKAFDDLLYALAGPDSSRVIAVLQFLTEKINGWRNAIDQTDPDKIANIGKGIAIIAGAFIGGGAVALLAALGPAGWLAAGIIGIGAACVTYGKQIDDWMNGFRNSLKSFWETMKGIATDRNFLLQNQSYTGPGIGGGGMQNIVYHPGGGIGGLHGGGGYSADQDSGVNGGRGGGSIGAPGMGAVNPAPTPGTGGNIAVPAGVMGGNSSIAASRAGFAAQLSDPNTRLQFAAMLATEGTPLQTAESAMNRSSYAHKTLMQMLHSGFYGPINRGALPGAMASLSRNPKRMAMFNAAINAALGGSDTIHGFTDQGMWNDPNGPGRYHGPYMKGAGGGNYFNDWGGGPGGHAGAARWRQAFESSHAHVDIGPVVASKAGGGETHVNLMMDGHKVAHHVMKHFTAYGNRPSSSGRLSDVSMTRPLGN